MTKHDKDAPLWWVSFSGETGFLGACVIEAENEDAVVPACWRSRCNPGGSVRFLMIPDSAIEHAHRYERGRLCSKAEIAAIDGDPPVKF